MLRGGSLLLITFSIDMHVAPSWCIIYVSIDQPQLLLFAGIFFFKETRLGWLNLNSCIFLVDAKCFASGNGAKTKV